jgi:peptidyl-prolyl cis-trans isomerase D
MFDLFRSRDKAVRILLGALLVIVALSMLTYLVPNYGGGSSGADSQIVAKVGDQVVTFTDVQRLIQNTMRGRQLPPEILPNYVPTIIDNMVSDRALAYEAQRLGFEVTDGQLRQAIEQLVPSLFPDGKFVGKEAYASLLAQQNLSIGEFEADLKRQLLVTRLRNIAAEGTVVSPAEIEREFNRKNEKIKIEFVKLSNDKLKNEVQVSTDDMQAYFKANSARFMVPDKRKLAILVADQKKIEESITPADADMQRVYTQEQAAFRIPETVKVRHILLKTQGKPATDEPKIKAQADDLLKQVKAGAKFADLVKKYSEDTGSVDKGGEYSVQKNGQMVPEFENAAFTLKPGESEIVKTTYGYHIMQVVQHDQARLKPFEEAKADIATALKKQRAAQTMEQISDRVQGALQKDPEHPEKVAAEFNMRVVTADYDGLGKPFPELGVSQDLDQAVATLNKGGVSPAVAVSGDKIALAVVTDVIPARASTFDEVKGQIKDAIVQPRLLLLVQDRARELIAKATSAGGDLAKAAKAAGFDVKTSAEFARDGNVEGVGSASYLQEGFIKPEGTVFGPISTGDGAVVAKVVRKVAADPSKLAEQRAQIRDDIKGQKARDRNALFESGLKQDLLKSGKLKIYQDVVTRIISSYRAS